MGKKETGKDGFVIFAFHNSETADNIKKELENNNIKTVIESYGSKGKGEEIFRLLIKEDDIFEAVRIIDCKNDKPEKESRNKIPHGNILIPVDFKPHSILACKVGFDLAERLSLQPLLLHAAPMPNFSLGISYDENFPGTVDTDPEEEIEDMMITNDLRKEAKHNMRDFVHSLREAQKKGELNNIEFLTEISEGVPEDVIREFCKTKSPELVVMATRGKQKKDEDLIGSVTAEVLDTCLSPVFSIPDNGMLKSIESIKRIVFFCNLDRHDQPAIDNLMRMFDYPEVSVTLVPVHDRNVKDIDNKMRTLCAYLNKKYPKAHFIYEIFSVKNFMQDFNNYESQANIEMIMVPNKRRNIFARLLNPGIAHKLLFERDIPLLAMPVGN